MAHSQRFRQIFAVLLTIILIDGPFALATVVSSPVGATGEYVNGTIADKALSYVGRWGGEACIDSQKPGDAGGQCRSFVNCIIWMASNHTQNLGGDDYFQPFLRAGGLEIHDASQLVRGDIVQEGQGEHTFIIVNRIGGDSFTVVDSNHAYTERVTAYTRTVTLDGHYARAFRMGLLLGTPSQNDVVGALDFVRPISGGVIVRGWVIDRNKTRPTGVSLYGGDGAPTTANLLQQLTADQSRPDVAASYQGYGADHGFAAFLPFPGGPETVCAYSGSVKLGCGTAIAPPTR